jgi:hypothetical protein
MGMKYFLILSVAVMLCVNVNLYAQEIQVTEIGMDNGKKSTKQQDHREAVVDAKLKAIEKAGVEIKSYTLMVDFALKEDKVEAQSEGIILPGYTITDIGYGDDGVYRVVLSGRVKLKTETKETGALRYALSLYEKGNKDLANKELERIQNGADDESRAGAIYYSAYWILIEKGYDAAKGDMDLIYDKIVAYYPKSPWTTKLKGLIDRNAEYLKQSIEEKGEMARDFSERKKALISELKGILQNVHSRYTFKKFNQYEIKRLIEDYINSGLERTVDRFTESKWESGTIRYGSGGSTYVHFFIKANGEQINAGIVEASDGVWHTDHTIIRFDPLLISMGSLKRPINKTYNSYIK